MAHRALTTGEIAMARTVYKGEINYSLPKIYNEKWAIFQPQDRAMAPNGNIYYAPGNPQYHSDFSAATVSIHHKATFIHELGHVWQHQDGQSVMVRGAFERDYDYLPMTAASSFGDYGIEEQAQVCRDYYYIINGVIDPSWPARTVYETVIPWLP